MARVAIIHEAPVPPPSARQLLIAFMKRGAETLYLRLSRLSSYITRRGMLVGYRMARALDLDVAVIRGIGVTTTAETLLKRLDVLRSLEYQGVLTINPADSLLVARDKLATLLRLRKAGLPTPETAVVEDVYEVSEIVREWGDVVIKPIMGSMGYGSVRTSNPDVAFIIAKTWLTYGQPIYLQRYERRGERDIRVLVVGNEVLGAIYRYAPPYSWKTNVSQGGKAERVKPDSELVELALRATKALGLYYSGVDIGETDGGYVIYEVNSSPQWRGFMTATGVNPAEKIAELALNMAKR